MKNRNQGRVDRILARLGATLSDPELRGEALRRIPRLIGKLLCVLFLAYACFAAIAFVLIDRVGERNLVTALGLYLPPTIWLVPLIVLFFPALVFHRRLALAMIVSAVAFLWFYVDWEPGVQDTATRTGTELTLLTYNRGQQAGSLQPFKNALKPDVIVMQDAAKRSVQYLRSADYGEFSHANDTGEFTLLSRYPITDSGLLTFHSGGRDYSPAAWFVLDFEGTSVVIFNIHLPTPREALRAFRRGAFLWGILGIPGTALGEKREHYQEFWDVQMDLAKQLDDFIRKEARPYLIAGDLNAPARGVIYRRFEKDRTDAHEVSGTGFGFTFPGVTRNPLSLFGPWMRIDHLFAGPGWISRECVTEKGRPSQHLAVAARMVLTKP